MINQSKTTLTNNAMGQIALCWRLSYHIKHLKHGSCG